MKKKLTKFAISIVIISGAFVIGMASQRLLVDFTSFPERIARYCGPVVFIIVSLFCSRNTEL